MDGDPPLKVGYRRATRKYMLASRFTAYDPEPTSREPTAISRYIQKLAIRAIARLSLPPV
jgi:hypothetical protein